MVDLAVGMSNNGSSLNDLNHKLALVFGAVVTFDNLKNELEKSLLSSFINTKT